MWGVLERVQVGMMALVTIALLSPSMYLLGLMGTPRYMSVKQMSMIWLTAVLTAPNSEPKVVLSTVDFLLQCQ